MKHEPITGERMTHWYAAVVKRQREQAACEALQAAGFIAYVPMETVEKRKPKRRLSRRPERYVPEKVEMVEVPIIRGIVIVGAPANLARDLGVWWGLLQVPLPGKDEPVIRAIYGNGGIPAAIPEREIEVMLAEADMRVTDLMNGGKAMFKADETIRIKAGAFQGFPATVKELIPDTHRYRAFTKVFGRDTLVELDEADMEKIAAE